MIFSDEVSDILLPGDEIYLNLFNAYLWIVINKIKGN